MSSWESDWRSEHFRTLKSLHSNNSIVITKPDKGSGVVILDYQCYVDKMMSILGDTSKFLRLGPVDNFDHTTSIETKFQRRLVEFVKRGLLSSAICDQIRPTGSIQPRLYGLSKTHEDTVPLRPMLSMVGSSQYKLAKWLDRIWHPVLLHYSTYCIKILSNLLVSFESVLHWTNSGVLLISVVSSLTFPSWKLSIYVQICCTGVIWPHLIFQRKYF